MSKIQFSKIAAAAFLVAISATPTMAGGPRGAGGALSHHQSIVYSGTLLPMRDQQSAGASGGGGKNCWRSCFNNFNECVGMRPKPHCVATMKLCLENCDRLSNRSGM